MNWENGRRRYAWHVALLSLLVNFIWMCAEKRLFIAIFMHSDHIHIILVALCVWRAFYKWCTNDSNSHNGMKKKLWNTWASEQTSIECAVMHKDASSSLFIHPHFHYRILYLLILWSMEISVHAFMSNFHIYIYANFELPFYGSCSLFTKIHTLFVGYPLVLIS